MNLQLSVPEGTILSVMPDAPTQERVVIEPFSLLKSIAEAASIFVALTFVAGWSYLASYYKTFGLNPVELEIPVPVVSTIALHMMYGSAWFLPVWTLVLVLIGAAARRFTRRRGSHRWWVLAALILTMFISAAAALFRGRQLANWDIREESPTLPMVAFSSKADAAKLGPPEQPSCVAFETFGGMDCKLLLHSKGVYYFFRPIRKTPANSMDKLDLYIIPDSDVVAVHIQRGLNLAGGAR
jgi:hypothetical protein